MTGRWPRPAMPGRNAVVAARSSRPRRPDLDFGVATGLVGEALAARGFTTIDGFAVPEMAAVAGPSRPYRTIFPAPGTLPVGPAPPHLAAIAGAGLRAPR